LGAGANSHIPVEQKELIDIMELVKAKKITQPQAKQQFCFWKTKQEAGPAKSFREKQVTTLLFCRSVMFLLCWPAVPVQSFGKRPFVICRRTYFIKSNQIY